MPPRSRRVRRSRRPASRKASVPSKKRLKTKKVPKTRGKVYQKKRVSTRPAKRTAKRKTARVRQTVSRPVSRPRVFRAAAWWRDPFTPEEREQLFIITGEGAEEQRAYVLAQKRLELVGRYQDMIRQLRYWSNAFTAAKGYPLTSRELVRIPASKIRKLELAYRNLKRAQGRAYVEFKPTSTLQRRAAKRQCGQIIVGQTRFFIHGVTGGPRVRAVWVKKDRVIQVTEDIHTTDKKKKPTVVQVFNRTYFFPHKPKSWADIRRMTEAIQAKGMKDGVYQIHNDLYGPIGEGATHDALLELLDSYFATYSSGFAGTIVGWSWTGNTSKAAFKREDDRLSMAERYKAVRDYNEGMRRRRIDERLGRAKRCKKCKRKKCRCPRPEFK